jgi:very-short-patch-repair endonuclease
MSRRVKVDITGRARSLRTCPTREERKIWELLSRYRPKFTRQLPIGPYIVDFACRQAKLAVEIDGGHHAESKRDIIRDRWLTEQGYRIAANVRNGSKTDPIDSRPEGRLLPPSRLGTPRSVE